MRPTFLGIGAQRCGTTWVYRHLLAHPEVFVSEPKELRYFTINYDRGPRWYESHFTAAGFAKARGEITPGYIYRPAALERIAQDLPDVRLFALLRNPIERAFSAYCFFRARDYRDLTFREALHRDKTLLEQGRYASSIRRLWRLFPRDRCLLMLYDDLRTAPGHTIRTLYAFLGVDPGYEPDNVAERVNTPIFPRAQALLGKLGLATAIDLVKRSPLGPRIRAWHARGDTTDAAIGDAELRLLRDFFRDDIYALGEMLQRDLHSWLE